MSNHVLLQYVLCVLCFGVWFDIFWLNTILIFSAICFYQYLCVIVVKCYVNFCWVLIFWMTLRISLISNLFKMFFPLIFICGSTCAYVKNIIFTQWFIGAIFRILSLLFTYNVCIYFWCHSWLFLCLMWYPWLGICYYIIYEWMECIVYVRIQSAGFFIYFSLFQLAWLFVLEKGVPTRICVQ